MFEYGYEEGFLTDGSVVIFPTDTVWGLACRLYDNAAIERIYTLKERSATKHLAVLCDNLVSVNDIAVIDERARKLAYAFWPGALTLILNSTKAHFEKTGDKTIGIRIPNHDSALWLIKKNGPLLTTSVNKSGSAPMMDLKEIIKVFGDEVDYIYEEYNAYYLNVSSTTIDLTNDKIEYLRIGSISKEDIEAVLEKDIEEI
ncbi:MAG: L-threonylcarbamoyladenylate synthase [Acholeplasmataceae bacterium]|nr:L-threonylcarbamoyladenylate synthase [Acholeplasmataceae bacterium]